MNAYVLCLLLFTSLATANVLHGSCHEIILKVLKNIKDKCYGDNLYSIESSFRYQQKAYIKNVFQSKFVIKIHPKVTKTPPILRN